MADHADDGDNDDVFVYIGGNQEVPRDVTHVRVHKSVKIITREAFRNCRNLVSIELHDGVEIIEHSAFLACTSLRRIKLPGVRVIGNDAFDDCTALEDVEFGDKLEIIGGNAFAGTAVRSVKLSKLRVIGGSAFEDCLQLTEVKLSEDLERIGEGAFYFCPRLRRISSMPLKDDMFVNDVFYQCEDLSQVDLVGVIHKTISSLLLESWRNEMNDEIERINQWLPNTHRYRKDSAIQEWMERVIRRIEYYKAEHCALLKESMTLLELALWKAKLDDNVDDCGAAQEGVRVTRGQRKRARKDSCITSGASIVIKNVLPFLKLG